MLKLYYHPSPNPVKVALFLEEANLPYELIPVDTRRGEQFSPEFLKVNPNAKTPALTDGEIAIFDSSAILLYLAEKTGLFVPPNTPELRAQMYSWLMFVATGIGPYSGQCVHFRHFAPEPKDYAVNRYVYEAERHWGILEAHLADKTFMVGDTYTLVDMSVWSWARMIPRILGDTAWLQYPHLRRHLDLIGARPAAQRVEALKDRHAYKMEVDEAARRYLFPQNARLAV